MGNKQGSNNQEKEKEEEIIIKCEVGDIVKQFFKDSVIIWHDPNISSPLNKPYIAQLENFCQVKTFTQFEEASAYIKQAKETCHVITLERHIEEICESQNVYAVYILGQNQENLLKNNPKVLCVEANIHNLLFKVEQNLIQNYEEKVSSQFSFAPIFDEKDKKKLNILHMYLRVIPNFRDLSQAKTDFLALCKVLYSDEKNFDFIVNLDQNYDHQNVLSWYTQQSLFSKVINNCLAISSSDSLQYCRLPLHDMQKAIHQQYHNKSKGFSGLLYKEVDLPEEEWSNLKGNIKKEIETLGFLSASKDLATALNFLQAERNKKVLVTVLIPKSPSKEEYGFAEIEHQVIFNTMSRFTILAANEQYSQEIPYRHLVLLYGLQSLRKYLTGIDSVQKIELEKRSGVVCDYCKTKVLEKSHKFFFRSLVGQSHYCQECLHNIPPTNKTSFLCVPVSGPEYQFTLIEGCLLTLPSDVKIPFYGYKCCQEKNHTAKVSFKCTECHGEWCEKCLENSKNCRQLGHAIILVRNPFSFWQERMSKNELKELQAEKENMPKDNSPYQQAEMYSKAHEYEKELDYYLKVLKVQEKSKPKTSPEIRILYFKIGGIYFRQHEYTKALQYRLELYRIFQSLGYQDTDPECVPFFVAIGHTYYYLGEYSKAEEFCLKALEISTLSKGKNDPSFGICYLSLGEICRVQGKYQKALEYSLKAFVLSKGDPSKLGSRCILLGHCYLNLGDYKKVEEYCIQALDIIQSIPGDQEEDLAVCYNLLGQVCEVRGDYKKAEEYYLKALEISDENQPEKLSYYNSMGLVYQRQGEYNKALEFHSQTLKKIQSKLKENHIHATGTYNCLAQVYCLKGEYPKALEYCLKAIEILKVTHGENHPGLGYGYKTLGQIYERKGEYNQALEYYLKSQELLRTFYGNNHPDTGECYCDSGNVYNHLGEYEKALEYQFRALQITESTFSENKNHPNLANCYSGLGQVYFNRKDYKTAMNYHLKSLNIRKVVHGENHPDVAECFVDIGDAYKGEGDDEKAKEYYLKALEIRKLMLGDDHPDTITIQKKIEEIPQVKEDQKETEI